MAENQKHRIFVIGRGEKDTTVYTAIIQTDAFDTSDVPLLLEQLRGDVLDEGRFPLDRGALDRARSRPPERALDIDLRGLTGAHRCVFVVAVDYEKEDGVPALQFLDPPFTQLATNAPDNETFLERPDGPLDPQDRTASFSCDLDTLRTSNLAGLIKKFEGNADLMKIPLMLNVTDPKLGCSPWVLPNDYDPGSGPVRLLTHGGVHPYASTNLIADI
jgi:hypothetical protein